MTTLKEIPCNHIVCPALNVLSVLAQEKSFGVALVGGAVRDTYFKRKHPSDYDIAVWDVLSSNLIEVALEDAGYELDRMDVAGVYESECNSGDGLDKYEWIAQFSHPVYGDVDVLCYTRHTTCLKDVLDKFDFNINQFAVQFDDISISEVQTAYYGGTASLAAEILLRLPGSTANRERTDHIIEIAESVGWTVPFIIKHGD